MDCFFIEMQIKPQHLHRSYLDFDILDDGYIFQYAAVNCKNDGNILENECLDPWM
jgi:hypothetical protein